MNNVSKTLYDLFMKYNDRYLHVSDIRYLLNDQINKKTLYALLYHWREIGVLESIGLKYSHNVKYKAINYDFEDWKGTTRKYQKRIKDKKNGKS